MTSVESPAKARSLFFESIECHRRVYQQFLVVISDDEARHKYILLLTRLTSRCTRRGNLMIALINQP